MQISPRYDGEPLLQMSGLVDEPAVPVIRQRARMAALLDGLDDEQWAAPTRCEGWSVQDVVAHLITTNQFWSLSVARGLGRRPHPHPGRVRPRRHPRPVGRRRAVPHGGLKPSSSSGPRTRRWRPRSARSARTSWSRLAEAPPGHIAIDLLALHALWDAWIHERDIALPLGLPVVEEADEIAGSLIYIVALGPAFLASQETGRTGTLEVRAIRPGRARRRRDRDEHPAARRAVRG